MKKVDFLSDAALISPAHWGSLLFGRTLIPIFLRKGEFNMAYAYSILSAVSNAAASAEPGVIDKLQSFTGTAEQSIAQQQIADPDYWSSVGIITLTGILVVFLILAILILFFSVLGVVFNNISKNEQKKVAEKKAEPAPSPVQQPVVEAASDDDSDDEEIMAVISAAIAAYAAEDGTSYTIRSVKRKDNRARSAWSLAGIGENTRPF